MSLFDVPSNSNATGIWKNEWQTFGQVMAMHCGNSVRCISCKNPRAYVHCILFPGFRHQTHTLMRFLNQNHITPSKPTVNWSTTASYSFSSNALITIPCITTLRVIHRIELTDDEYVCDAYPACDCDCAPSLGAHEDDYASLETRRYDDEYDVRPDGYGHARGWLLRVCAGVHAFPRIPETNQTPLKVVRSRTAG